MNAFDGNLDLVSAPGDAVLTPRCRVDIYMLKLVSNVLSHVLTIRQIMADEDDDQGLEGALSCERFLGVGWQANFLKRFCVELGPDHAGEEEHDLIALQGEQVNLRPRPSPRYRQAYPSTVVLVDEDRDLDLTTILPLETEFNMSDVSHTM